MCTNKTETWAMLMNFFQLNLLLIYNLIEVFWSKMYLFIFHGWCYRYSWRLLFFNAFGCQYHNEFNSEKRNSISWNTDIPLSTIVNDSIFFFSTLQKRKPSQNDLNHNELSCQIDKKKSGSNQPRTKNREEVLFCISITILKQVRKSLYLIRKSHTFT